MNTRDLPGPGDYERLPITSPNDPRCDAEDIGEEEAIKAIAEHVFDERMASVTWIGDAQGDISDADWRAIAAATVAGDAMEIGRIVIEATRRTIKADSMTEARVRIEKLRREDEADAAAARMGH